MCVLKESLQKKSLMGFKILRSWRPYHMKTKILILRTICRNFNAKK